MTVLDPQAGPRMESWVAQYGLNGNPGDGDHVDVSIVMPCLNEEEAIRGCIDEARASLTTMGLAGEILVVDNGSTDGSVQVALDAGARVVHEPDRGYGNACRRGLQEARGRYVVLGDADGTYDFSALPSFVEPLYNGSDMVMGSRLKGTIDDGAMPWLHRYIGNPFLTMVMNVLFSNHISDAHCGLRSIKKESVSRMTLMAPGMEFASEFLIEAMRQGVRMKQVPIHYRRRMGGQPKLRTFQDGWRHLSLMVHMAPGSRLSASGLPTPVSEQG